MASSSSEESSDVVYHNSASSGLESTSSLLFSAPSDSSGVQTDITPPTSPTQIDYEGKSMTPRDILEASHRLAQLSQSSSQVDITPAKTPKQRHHHRSYLRVNDEAGYETDGDDVTSTSTSTNAGGVTKVIHRPKFPRVDTKLRRRVASLLGNRPPFGDTNDITPQPYHVSILRPSTSLKKTLARESHELQRRTKGQEPIGLGLGVGLPGDWHPLRNRSFTMPSISPTAEEPSHSEWLPSLITSPSLLNTIGYPSVMIPVALQPTLPEISPSPIDGLPPSMVPSSMVRYGETVELTTGHLAALAYTPEYSTSSLCQIGGMQDVRKGFGIEVGEAGGTRAAEETVMARPKDAFLFL